MATSAFAIVSAEEVTSTAEEILEALTQETIAARAYELWQERGCPEGSPEVDWFQAEEELLNS